MVSALDRSGLTRQVLRNCRITDARYAGLHSVCGLALRLRDLYKWEAGLSPWAEPASGAILDWIGEKEDLWEALAEENVDAIRVKGREYDPFDSAGINDVLLPHGLYYGAGYVSGLRPTFVLAELEDHRRLDGETVYTVGRELARDLLSLPALSREGSILLRRQAAGFFLWDQILFVNKSGRPALRIAMKAYGLDISDAAAIPKRFPRVLSDQMEVCLHHELGELQHGSFDRAAWEDLVAIFPHSPIELLARGIKDLLADTCPEGLLPFLIRERKLPALAMHVAFQEGVRQVLFPELKPAFENFLETSDWGFIEKATALGFDRACDYAGRLRTIYRQGKDRDDPAWMAREITAHLLAPLKL